MEKNMKITLKTVQGVTNTLNKLLSTSLPVVGSFKVLRLAKQLVDVQNDLESQRVKLVEKYGEKNENGGFSVTEQNMEPFKTEFSSLLETEVEVLFEPFSISLLGDVKLTPIELMVLEPFLKE